MAMQEQRFKVTVLIGTRPEAIKMAPVVKALQNAFSYEPRVLLSGQQMTMSKTALQAFGVKSENMLLHQRSDFSLSSQASGYLEAVSTYLKEKSTDLMLVHGDTTTGFIGALAAFYQQIPVGHVEAGLRSYDLQNPFPEEAHRRLIDPLCTLLFAPTARARQNLVKENVDSRSIVVTGNTVVDAVQTLSNIPPSIDLKHRLTSFVKPDNRIILLTAHRRENWGAAMNEICHAVRILADRYADLRFVIPVHPNPNVSRTVHTVLGDHPQMLLMPPLDYMDLIAVMRDAYLILTDSGGIQEEAPCVGTPVLILRGVTERPEVVEGGCGRLIGTRREDIVGHTARLLECSILRNSMLPRQNPFGDGHASHRIVSAIGNWRYGRPLNFENKDFSFDVESVFAANM